MPCKHALTYAFPLAQCDNIFSGQRLNWRQATFIEVTHGLLIHETNGMEVFHGLVNGCCDVAPIFFSHHR